MMGGADAAGSKPLIESILSSDNLEILYQMYRSEEKAGKKRC
jgi:hypothetical protein